MLIGAAKAGSTSFSRYLAAHPQVVIRGPKEPNYWSWRRHHAKYQDFFVNQAPVLKPAPGQYISGEFSTSSLIHPLVPRRVLANLPDVRIIVLLRNPIDRAYSHFRMALNAGQEAECTFEEIVRREITECPELLAAHERGFLDPAGESKTCYSAADGVSIRVARHTKGLPATRLRVGLDLRNFYRKSYVFRSIYHDQLHRWLRLFPRDQVLVIQSERFFADTPAAMNDVVEFLGLQPFDFSTAPELRRVWATGSGNVFDKPQNYPGIDSETRRLLADYFEPYNQQLYTLIGRDFKWD